MAVVSVRSVGIGELKLQPLDGAREFLTNTVLGTRKLRRILWRIRQVSFLKGISGLIVLGRTGNAFRGHFPEVGLRRSGVIFLGSSGLE
jgi:hypothetical protein